MHQIAANATTLPIAALLPVVLLALAFVGYCLYDLARSDVRYLPKWAWALACLASVPVGGIVYLLVGKEHRREVARRRTALLPDTPQFDPWLTGREVVALALRLVAPEIPGARVDEVLHDAGLTDAASRRVGGYSRGMLQRLGIAATVIGEPDLLLLDEPASALDPAGRREVLDLIAHLRGRATVVLSSHILGDVQEVCDDVGILRSGQLLFQGPLETLLVPRRATFVSAYGRCRTRRHTCPGRWPHAKPGWSVLRPRPSISRMSS